MERKTLRWVLAAGISTSVLFAAFTPRVYLNTEPSKFGTALAGRATLGNKHYLGLDFFIARGYFRVGVEKTVDTVPCTGTGSGDGIGIIYFNLDSIDGLRKIIKAGC